MMRVLKPKESGRDRFWPVAMVLGFLWMLGLISGQTMGVWVHLPLAVLVVMVLVRYWPGRHPA